MPEDLLIVCCQVLQQRASAGCEEISSRPRALSRWTACHAGALLYFHYCH